MDVHPTKNGINMVLIRIPMIDLPAWSMSQNPWIGFAGKSEDLSEGHRKAEMVTQIGHWAGYSG